jgi:glucokinase
VAKASKGECTVGFDLGGTKMLAWVFGRDFQSLGRERKKTKAFEGVDRTLERMAATIRGALEDAGMAGTVPSCIGIGSPGPLDPEQGVILETPNLGWKDVHLKEYMENEFKCPVAVINDVDAGVYGEYRFGAARHARCAVGIFPGTGIGGGCVYKGELMQGKSLSCMEVGHMPVIPEGPVCGCGNRGCLEAVASRLAISAAAAVAARRGKAPHLLEKVGTDLANIRSKALAASIAAGDSAVEGIVRDAAGWLGRGVATLVNLLGVDTVVLGGGLVEAMPELYLEEVKRSSEKHVHPAFRDTYDIAAAELGDDATATGAAAWARHVFGGGSD